MGPPVLSEPPPLPPDDPPEVPPALSPPGGGAGSFDPESLPETLGVEPPPVPPVGRGVVPGRPPFDARVELI